jgi:hypothetical protein
MKSQESVWMLPKTSTFLFHKFKKWKKAVLNFVLPFAQTATPFAKKVNTFNYSAVPFASPAAPFAMPAAPFASPATPFASPADTFNYSAAPFASPVAPFALSATMVLGGMPLVLALYSSNYYSLRYPSERNSIIHLGTRVRGKLGEF